MGVSQLLEWWGPWRTMCAGEAAATGAGDMALLRLFLSSLWQLCTREDWAGRWHGRFVWEPGGAKSVGKPVARGIGDKVLLDSFSRASQVVLVTKNPPASAGDIRDVGLILGFGKSSLEEGMATHSNIFAWRIPWTEEVGRLQSTGSHRVGHN